MDPLSMTAGVVGFISFFHGIGNFLAKVAMAKKDEKEAIKQFTVHIRHMERILSEVQGCRQELDSVSPGNQSVDFSELEACLDECRAKLQKFVDKLKDPNIKRKALLNRLKWPLRQEKSKKIIDLVNQYKSSLQLELAIKQGRATYGTSRDIHGTVQEIYETAQEMHGEVQEILHGTAQDIQMKAAAMQEMSCMVQHGEILKRLDVVNVNIDFDKARAKCHPRTGGWFLKSPSFGNFKEKSGKHLWLHGMPGAGKTVLSGSIIAALREYVKDQPTYALAYFFFSYTDQDKQNVYNMLSSIAGQFCRQARTIPGKVIMELEHNMTRLPTSVLVELISCLFQCFGKVYIVLDALDEIKLEERSSLIGTLQTIIGLQSNINLLITSRHENYLINGFNGLQIQQIPLCTVIIDEDIQLYVRETFLRAPILWGWDSKLCKMTDKIVERLTKGAKGMFRWVDCQMESLKNCQRCCDVEDILCTLPEDLDETYKRILLSVPKRYQIYVARLLAWIVFTPKRLCVHVLAEAIIFEPALSKLHPGQRFENVDSIGDLCRSLINTLPLSVTQQDYHPSHRSNPRGSRYCLGLSLAHYSVQEYFLSECFKQEPALTVYSSLFKHSPSYIMDVWIKYWEMATLEYSPDHYADEMWSNSRPLLKHCITASMEHGRDLASSKERSQWVLPLAHLVCNNFNLINNVLSFKEISYWCPMSLFAYYDLYEGIEICNSHGHNAHSITWESGIDKPRTLLSLAVKKSYQPEQKLAILIKNGASDILNGSFGKYSPALFCAHGSVIESPHYPRGSLIPYLKQYTWHQLSLNYDKSSSLQQLLQSLTAAPFDSVFVAPDGLIHSFVGETAGYYAEVGNLSLLHDALMHGAKIEKPVKQCNMVTRLYGWPVKFTFEDNPVIWYFSYNIFCTSMVSLFRHSFSVFSKNDWVGLASLLVQHGGDINALDCISGTGTQDEIFKLEYCTALDLLRNCDPNQAQPFSANLWSPSCVLEEYGAKILPREPVPKGTFRICITHTIDTEIELLCFN